MKKKIFFIIFIITLGNLCFSSEAYNTGYNLFSRNKPQEAIPYFVSAMADVGVSPSIYIYLGIAYYQLGQYSESLDTFKKGLAVSGTNKRIIAYNAGNTAYAMKDYSTAEEMYSMALAADPKFSAPVLNRANARLSQQKYTEALSDYEQYLVLDPATNQRSEVEQVIAALKGEIAFQEAEKERIAQEEERIRQENERIAAEKAEAARKEAERLAAERAAEEARLAAEREAEAERRRKMLEEVANSLKDSETTGMNAGTEGVIEYEYESELD